MHPAFRILRPRGSHQWGNISPHWTVFTRLRRLGKPAHARNTRLVNYRSCSRNILDLSVELSVTTGQWKADTQVGYWMGYSSYSWEVSARRQLPAMFTYLSHFHPVRNQCFEGLTMPTFSSPETAFGDWTPKTTHTLKTARLTRIISLSAWLNRARPENVVAIHYLYHGP